MHNWTLSTTLAAFALATLCAADQLASNQIDDGFHGGRLTRARYAVKTCQPCAQNQCQVMGMQRFAEPRCEAFGGAGAPCRPGFQEPENKTLNFPNAILYCDNVYMQFCPCARGHRCSPQEARCVAIAAPARPTATQRPNRQPWPQFEYNALEGRRAPTYALAELPAGFELNDGRRATEVEAEVDDQALDEFGYELPEVAGAEEAAAPGAGGAPSSSSSFELSTRASAAYQSATVRRQPQWPWALMDTKFDRQ